VQDCPICYQQAGYQPLDHQRVEWRCERCGNFIITGTAEKLLENSRAPIDRTKLSAIVKGKPRDTDGWFSITEVNVKALIAEALRP